MLKRTDFLVEAIGEEGTAAFGRRECLVQRAKSRAATMGAAGMTESSLDLCRV